ncbi:MAG TPA: LysR family substrate-binding domain-containing protein [Propionicimonas sp.]|nr:LysR family substrate-binding domain-containing protein [Propionicimonas sp.]
MTSSVPDAHDRTAGIPGLRIGFVPGVTLTKWRRIWADRMHRVPLDVVEVTQAGQRAALVSGEVDMCFVRLPIDTDGLHTIALYEEVPVVVAPKDHPLAAFDDVSLADLAGETFVVDDAEATGVDRVAWGAGLMLVPLSVARSHSRRDLIHRPVTDAEPTAIALAWLVDNPNELIEEFIGIVRGRTANSSRTAASRGSSGQEAKAAPAKKRTPAAKAPRNTGRPARGQRRR